MKSYQSKEILHEGRNYANKRQYALAEASFLDALSYNPGNTEAWISLGDIYFIMDHYEEAKHSYEEALKHNKEAFGAYAGLWKVRLEETGYPEEARKEVKKEIEDFISSVEKNPEGLMAAHEGFSFLHEYEEALQLAKNIVALVPDEEDLSTLATYTSEELLRERDVEKRLKMIEEFRRLFPFSKEVPLVNTLKLSMAAKDLKDKEALFQYGEEWIRDAPDNRRANFSVAYWYTQEGIALDRAVLYLRKALSLIADPDPADKPDHYSEAEWRKDLIKTKGIYYDTLGWAYYKMGRYKQAEKTYRRGTRYLDYDPNLYYHLGQLLEEKGDTDGAIKSYIQALKSGENKEAEERLMNLLTKGGEPIYKLFAKEEGITPFTDVTGEAGLSDIKAIRVAWGDYNNDGYEDILLNGSILFKNNGNGTFTNVTSEAGIIAIPGANGGVWGDMDNDGHLDFYTFASGSGTFDRFWVNNGDGTFRDITGTAVQNPDPYPTEAAAWGDFDNDGFIDIYLANYEKPLLTTVERARCLPDRLLHNSGNRTFTDVSATAGTVSPENMCGRGVNWGDYDNDGDSDIYVTNYRLDPNFLWQNNGDGTFSNMAEETGVEGHEEKGYYGHSIGAEWGDYDNDGDLDLFVSNLAHPRYIGISDKSMLLENQGPYLSSPLLYKRGDSANYRFKNRFADSGIRFEETPADPSFADYDNDGILDLYFTSTYKGRKSFLYKGNGDGTFTDVTWLAGVRVDDGWGNAFADYDNDGDLDLLVASSGGVRLFRNDGNDNHWLQVRIVGRESNRAGIGARVTVVPSEPSTNTLPPHGGGTGWGGLQLREIQGGKGSGNQHSLPVEFGIGSYSGSVDVEVRFPSGKVIRVTGINTNQMIVVEE